MGKRHPSITQRTLLALLIVTAIGASTASAETVNCDGRINYSPPKDVNINFQVGEPGSMYLFNDDGSIYVHWGVSFTRRKDAVMTSTFYDPIDEAHTYISMDRSSSESSEAKVFPGRLFLRGAALSDVPLLCSIE